MSAEKDFVVGQVKGLEIEVSPDETNLLRYVRDLRDPGAAQLLLDWQNWLVANLAAYATEALQLVSEHSPRSTRILRVVMTAWAEQQQEIAVAIRNRLTELLTASKPVRPVPPPPDAAQPGDVRSRYGETQVHLDGRWFALGVERAP